MDVIVEGKPKLLNSRYTDVWIKGMKGWISPRSRSRT
jgi:hypothetical protein